MRNERNGRMRKRGYNFINLWHALKRMPWTSFVVSEYIRTRVFSDFLNCQSIYWQKTLKEVMFVKKKSGLKLSFVSYI